MAERYERQVNNSGGGVDVTISLDDVAQAGAGATGSKTSTAGGSAYWVAQLVGLRQVSTTAVTGVTFAGNSQAAGAIANWTVGFTTSAAGALNAGKTITVVFNPGFTVPATPTVTLGVAFGGSCTATGSGSGTTVTVTLAGTCTLGNSTATTLTIAGLTNPAAGTLANTTFSVSTTADAVVVNPAANVVITAASAVTGVTFSGSSTVAGATANWTEGFTTSASGALNAGKTITVVFNPGFTVPATPTIVLNTGFTSCTATGSATGQTVTITLAGASCAVPNSGAATLTINGITNPLAAGPLAANTFSVKTSQDGAAVSPASAVTITAGAFTKLQLLVPGETAAPGTGSGKTGTPNSSDLRDRLQRDRQRGRCQLEPGQHDH